MLASIAQAVIFQFSFVVSYYDGVLDEMVTYDDSDGFSRGGFGWDSRIGLCRLTGFMLRRP